MITIEGGTELYPTPTAESAASLLSQLQDYFCIDACNPVSQSGYAVAVSYDATYFYISYFDPETGNEDDATLQNAINSWASLYIAIRFVAPPDPNVGDTAYANYSADYEVEYALYENGIINDSGLWDFAAGTNEYSWSVGAAGTYWLFMVTDGIASGYTEFTTLP